jgi:hypothetical protein
MLRITLFAALLSGCVDDATASESSSITGPRDHRPPPQEALVACASSAAGASCAFDFDGHHITGTCKNGPDGSGPLACVPLVPPPPPEAIAACSSSSAGATCAFDIDGHHVDGTCRNGPDGQGPLACAPAQQPPPP